MSREIRVAALGLGRLGYYHTKNLKEKVRGAKLVSVADPFGDQAQKAAAELGVEKWTKNPDDVFQDPEIDAVIIVTPTTTHGEMIKKAAKHGKHIFVEKPLTQSLNEAEEVIQAVEDHQVICQVGFMRRFDPSYYDAKKRIEAGDIGKPIYFKGITRDFTCPPEEFIKNSGGIFLDCSIHDYDIARYLMGAEITSVSAHGTVVQHPYMSKYNDVDQAITYIEFDSGAAGDVEASRNSRHGYDIRAEIIGTEGSLFVGTFRNRNAILLNAKGSNYEVIPDFQTRFNDAYLLELEEFIKCVQENKEPRITALDSKINMQIAAAATKSFLNNGEKIFLETSKTANLSVG
ncbi:scyllo-inositol 2-dehydrogenase (NAD+) [Scopulibacillus daqui]|uniref:Scyllo-inositol 2-dehydrogenase (NAD+) n=1 Tax=Scopulibacillus daqui TaxID=1469162 RepID=A0ABS2Q2W1_9BACL|nr:inositol 2-dehydrogenase [Scopulibacillus daqui]MBM7646632.1 scyllo-inositol 2-dehydrogenase (NAD+) [Scopulibacillus daqui]